LTSNNEDSSKRSLHVGSGIHVTQLSRLSQHPSPLSGKSSSSQSVKVIVKERFPKKYRHSALDLSLTKTRTKGEARSLIRCKRADVACPNVLAIANWSNVKDDANNHDKNNAMNCNTTCLFIEHVPGCTVRQYFEQRMESAKEEDLPSSKRQRLKKGDNSQFQSNQEDRITTVIDSHTLSVAHNIGTLVGKMHAAGVIHGDLTTSNIMVTNVPQSTVEIKQAWNPQLVLIDFGLATSTNSTVITNNTAVSSDATSSGSKKAHKQQHSAEEKAVDLYVLERAFLSTHPESDQLVEEVFRGYREFFEGLKGLGSHGGSEGSYGHVAKTIFNRLEQVRLRGRKRECFG
jgi:TP53 regulating kinase-like protein